MPPHPWPSGLSSRTRKRTVRTAQPHSPSDRHATRYYRFAPNPVNCVFCGTPVSLGTGPNPGAPGPNIRQAAVSLPPSRPRGPAIVVDHARVPLVPLGTQYRFRFSDFHGHWHPPLSAPTLDLGLWTIFSPSCCLSRPLGIPPACHGVVEDEAGSVFQSKIANPQSKMPPSYPVTQSPSYPVTGCQTLFLCQMRDFPRRLVRHLVGHSLWRRPKPNGRRWKPRRAGGEGGPHSAITLSAVQCCFFVKCEIFPPTPNATPPTSTYARPAEVMHIKVCT